ncbi:MAG TPA: LacI family DNA-binding transcriptional regulator [Candidatus Choladousia intestinigallinarum]|nr:LacI family DNA-binding transcriptional regulator [Candidatus Choladousia intestinigallinarum]
MDKITIKDVALRAGVSVATVSRVINNAETVRPETASRVLAAIKETDYIPNAAARNLKTATNPSIGFIVSNISNSHFTQMARTIENILRQSNYSLFIASTDDSPEAERECLRRMVNTNAAGIILNTTGKNDDFVSELSAKTPFVLVDRSISAPEFKGDFVGSNGYGGIQALVRHLFQYGHRDIAFITSDLSTSTGRERLAGFADAMQSIGIQADENYIYRYTSGHFNEEGGAEGCRYLMNLPKRPTAIVVGNNEMAIGVYKYLYHNKISVPGDISVVSYGNITNSDLFRKEPTIVTLDPTFIGKKAANLLLSRIAVPELGNRESIFEPLLRINETTRRI